MMQLYHQNLFIDWNLAFYERPAVKPCYRDATLRLMLTSCCIPPAVFVPMDKTCRGTHRDNQRGSHSLHPHRSDLWKTDYRQAEQFGSSWKKDKKKGGAGSLF